MTEMNFSRRRRRALKSAEAIGADSLLITHHPDVRYLCGFTGSSGALAISKGKNRLFTDGRYREQAKHEATGTTLVIENRPPAQAAILWLDRFSETCAVDALTMTVAEFETLRGLLQGKKKRSFLRPSKGLVAQLRQIKDEAEIEQMRSAAALGCTLFDRAVERISSDQTETEIALFLEHDARLAGAEAMSFDTIVASGERSSLPHGRATNQRLPKQGFVTLDFGVVLNGYCSDMTRTVHLGRPKAEARSVYDFVLEAQLAAVSAVRAGVEAATVDEAARSVLRRAGLDGHFIHSTGHGVGLEIHEGPRIAAKQTSRLEAGMVITIEPGVYLSGRFGVRIEDMVLVTADGGELLTPSTKALIEL